MHAFLKPRDGSTPLPKSKVTPSTSEKSKPNRPIPWVEKYRPQTIDDVCFQDEVVAVLKRSLHRSDIPNLLFYGPPGTGKTSTILALARQLFGADQYKSRILELNASDERGINVVREKVKNFASLASTSLKSDGSSCPPFKIVILDEADCMTSAAQAALRRTMETHNNTTRFCLICNYISRIIAPVVSRCAKFRFKPLSRATLLARIKFVCDSEQIQYSDETISALMIASEGDLRRALTILQSSSRLKINGPIEVSDIQEIAAIIPEDVITDLLSVCRSDSYEKLELYVTGFINNGYSASRLLSQFCDLVVDDDSITDRQKSVILEKMAIADRCLMDGASEYLQIMDLCCVIMKQLCSKH